MRTRVVQKDVTNRDLTAYLRSAREDGIELICFGELAVSGCLYSRRAVKPIESWLELFAPYGLRVMCGLPVRDEEARLQNVYLYCYEGRYLTYSKVHLFPAMNEDKVYTAGTSPGIWQTDFGRVGVAICYDIRFEGLFTELRRRKVETLFVPAAFPRVRIGDWSRLLIERARQCRCPVVGINAIGNDGVNEFGGRSAVLASDGSVIAEADETSETILDVDL
ncbi:MAG TPA: nitrilase-related carbon-nitrogen hydrolase [Acidobacteriota bacterium]|nr:nitrilase-related carbon-nitrogen hydrolase [Acidobacteriota bacterium]